MSPPVTPGLRGRFGFRTRGEWLLYCGEETAGGSDGAEWISRIVTAKKTRLSEGLEETLSRPV